MKEETRDIAYLLEDVMQNKFDYGFYQEDLWEYCKNKRVEEYKMEDVMHWIYKPCWSFNICNNECYISIYQVLQQKKSFKNHIKRIKNANTTFPLIVIEDEFDKMGSIIDGNHRFAKLILNKNKKVKFTFISKKELNNLKIKI